MAWPDRKFSDDLGRVENHLAYPTTDVKATSTVEAPCCGRECAADMVCEVPGEGWCCDACRSELRRDSDTEWDRPTIMRAMGASAVEVRREYVKMRARTRYINAKRRNETVRRREILQTVDDEVPRDQYPPDTQPPL